MVLASGLEWAPSLRAESVPATGPVRVPAGVVPDSFPSFADLAEAVGPAVVSIQAASIQSAQGRRRPRQVDPFEFFFGPRRRSPESEPEGEGRPQRFRQDSGGSGFIISADGLVITNNHVVEGADRLSVLLDGRQYAAEVRGTDPATDLALIQIQPDRELTYLELGDSDEVRVGDWVMAIGSPLGLDHSVTTGVVSAKGRSLGIADQSFENFIQTDAAINFGNSGGPLVNTQGRVVAIATAINYGAENIGFAVPVNTLKQILPQLRESGRVRRGYLGIEVSNLDYDSAKAFGLDKAQGALVGNVTAGSPAEKAGVQHGDIILRVDDVEVRETRDLINYVSNEGPDAEVDLVLLREGERLEKSVKLGERPEFGQPPIQPEDAPASGIDWMGIDYQNLTPGLRNLHGISEGVQGIWVTNVEPDSPLYEEGVRPGDVLSEVNGQRVTSAAEFEAEVAKAGSGGYLRLYVIRSDPNSNREVKFFAFAQVP
jgi:serine protease Do